MLHITMIKHNKLGDVTPKKLPECRLAWLSVGTSINWSKRLACATRGGGRSEAGHCFHLLFSFFFFFYAFCCSPTSVILRKLFFSPALIFWHNAFYFSPTSGKLPWLKICFPQYFGITRRNIYLKKMIGHFLFF